MSKMHLNGKQSLYWLGINQGFINKVESVSYVKL